ncbi:hypothetical protein LTS02_001819 [Friedmanniomyces endolithicus]|nr:hypothetical protein LTR94_018469 [Friedmanniomyces endolithicus]KAK0815459.1 hypothetical protein LTR59_000532 [Friedmanniomyces endolithicus]KAK0818247.1 hypothetical protein LTR38_001294 [Friedmanniomyces endolithicus]KAK0819415.1 hypothetical protein LTR75_002184 [Friedmanniomyces endolithicus]KAK0845450.1 hypothetical protein LTR03_007507 [Friedmanniomyces endolithicus]
MATIPEVRPVGAGELYTPIASWQTRILRLHSSSGGKNDVLRADLLVVGLLHDEGVVFGMDNEEPTTYEAISYSWGPDNATERIIVNGLRRHINPSLAGALRRFRLPEESRYLWADAICIDQAGNAEKSAQVRSMFTIFRKARRVLAWLGDQGTGGSQALASYEAKCNTLKGNPWANMRGVLLDEEDAYDDLAIVALVPWPRRAWVQQEVFAAQELTLYYGKCEMSLDHYFGLLVGLCKSPIQRRLDELERQRKVLSSLCGLRRSDERLSLLELGRLLSAKREHSATFLEGAEFRLRKAEPAVSAYDATRLEQGLSRSRFLEARDPRDYIYALLSLTHLHMARSQLEEAQSVRGTAMYIDYSKSITRVFQDATRSILNRDRNLQILTHSHHRGASRLNLDLPSWVVDWTSVADEADYYYRYSQPSDSMLTRQQHSDSGTEILHGFRLGYLTCISDQTKLTVNAEETAHHSEQRPTHLAAISQPRQTTTVSQLKYRGFNKTLTLTLQSHITLKPTEALSWDWIWTTETHPSQDFQLPSTHATRLTVGDLFVQVEGWDLSIILREEEDVGPAKRFRLVDVLSDQDFLITGLRAPPYEWLEAHPTSGGSKARPVRLTNRLCVRVSPGDKEDFVVC